MVDIGSVGDAATAGLVAGAIEKPTGKAGEPHHLCSDCGAELTGRFCAACGQPAHVHRSLLHLGEEILHGVMHFDGRLWRTIPLLLFRPGQLTREWVQGKRTRYVSPLAMFLFTVFVMFMLISYAPAPLPTKTLATVRAEAAADVANRATALARAEEALKAATTDEARAEAQAGVKAAQAELESAREDLQGVSTAADVMGEGDWKERLSRSAHEGKLGINLPNKKLQKKIEHLAENPDLAIYKFQQTFYKFSFLLIPISIPFVALLFLWKRGFTLYDHGVFVLYSMTFMSLLITVMAVAARLPIAWTVGWAVIPFIVPAHMFFQLKGAYGLSWFSAAWRTWFLLWFCFWALIIFGLVVVRLGLM
ncbi:DUF3667 domain-containing protein [Phenylobacterium sp. J367]|uniref:DUF3667 domain-containing protein n=1 Tax=Phenylobacterium sp. J367 TaxID=2898435 RepID=UPI0021518C1B|nr:DUF3667 domain-containing protein [Phenylobacterium sp. J367]MCR5879340.1 DUF3667 domain-containing protein [Phenylobacterium sp. J367]